MLYKLDNGLLEATIESKGAELKSLKIKKNTEFIWNGDPKYWSKSSPILFPFVGGIKGGKYTYKGTSYKGTKHGFARHSEFEMIEHLKDQIVFKLSSTEITLKEYPFDFDFYITYCFEGNELLINYKVVNKTKGKIYFSLGAHPAFATPTNKDVSFEDYYLEFEQSEEGRKTILEDSCITNEKVNCFSGFKMFLEKDTFINDVVAFESLKSKKVALKNTKNNRYIEVDYRGFPFIGFWNIPGADYVCIEPWCGIADYIDTNGKLEEKYGIEKLEDGEEYLRGLRIKVGL